MEANSNYEKAFAKEETHSVEGAQSTHINTDATAITKPFNETNIVVDEQAQKQLAPQGRSKNEEHESTGADTVQSLSEDADNDDNEQAIEETDSANLQMLRRSDKTLAGPESETTFGNLFERQHVDIDEAITEADSGPIFETADDVTSVVKGRLYTTGVNIDNKQHYGSTETVASRMGLTADHVMPHEEDEEQISYLGIDSDQRKVLTEFTDRLGNFEDTFQNYTSEIKTRLENIVSKNKELEMKLEMKVNPLEQQISDVSSQFSAERDTHLEEITYFNSVARKETKEFEERVMEDCQKLEEKTETICDTISKLHKDKGDLDRKIFANETRWNSVMHEDEREQSKARLMEQKRLLKSLKDESHFRKDRLKEFMREVQVAKEKEVKELKDKLNDADRLKRHLISQHEDKIKQSEKTLVAEIDALVKEKEELAKERDRLQKSGDVSQNRQLRNRVEYLNAEIQKRDEYILLQEERLSKTREAAALLNELTERNYERYRQLYRNWQEVDRRLNEQSAGIKQRFRQGDGQSLVDTLTWVQTTIERMPGNCIHANDFQRMTGIINNAIHGDYSGIRTDIAFQQEPNCVLQ